MKSLVICRRELHSYFGSFIAYVLLAVFLLLSGYFFYSDLIFFVLFGGFTLATGLWQFLFIDMRLVAIDEARRAARRGDLRRHHLLGIGTAGRHLDGAETVLLDILGVAAELACGEMLRLDAAAAAFIENFRPALERERERRSDRLGMADAADEFLLRARDHRRADKAQSRRGGCAFYDVAPANPRRIQRGP